MSRCPKLVAMANDSLREAFGRALVKYANEYPNMIVLDGDVAGGTGAHNFRTHYPSRFIQCGIAEQNMVSMAGGMASIGLIPVVTTFSVFLLRAYEQARLSIAYPNLNAKLVGSHPGLDVGPDGSSAQCLEDLAVFRAMPNMSVISPCDPLEIEQATKFILDFDGPIYMRTGRSAIESFLGEDYRFEFGKGKILKDGNDIALFGCGVTTGRNIKVAEKLSLRGINAMVVNLSTIKPIDKEIIAYSAQKTKKIISVEDHNIYGGLGSAIAEVLVEECPTPMKIIGVKDLPGQSGEPEELSEHYGLSVTKIYEQAITFLEGTR